MKDLTYIIPTRIESEDRLKNIITSVTYLLKNFPEAKVIAPKKWFGQQFAHYNMNDLIPEGWIEL